MLTLLSAIAFFAGAAIVLITSNWKNTIFWVLLGVGLYILSGVDFDLVTN